MIIAIKSEMDSRPLLYPLLRALRNYGSICLISSNRIVNRLNDGEDNGGFRNITVVVDEGGGTDDVYREYGIVPEDYDFVILDNMGAIEYDTLIVPVGLHVTEDFQQDIDLLKQDSHVRFIQFAKAGKGTKPKKDRPKKERPKKDAPRKKDLSEDDYDPAEKFRVDQSIDEEFNVAERWYNCSYPTWDEVEAMEAVHKFPAVSGPLCDALYDMFKLYISIDKRMFEKDMKKEERITGRVDAVNADI